MTTRNKIIPGVDSPGSGFKLGATVLPLLAGIVLGACMVSFLGQGAAPGIESRPMRLGGHEFTEPLLACAGAVARNSDGIASVLRSAVLRHERDGDARRISAYVADLRSGEAEEVNGKEKYSPASLLKVSLLIAYLGWAEREPEILSRTFVYEPSLDTETLLPEQVYLPDERLVGGQAFPSRSCCIG